MNQFVIEQSTGDEDQIVRNGFIDYNRSKAPFTQDPPVISINRVIKGTRGEVLARIMSKLYAWNCLHIDMLWVKEDCRRNRYGSALHFYTKYGYEVFGQLDIPSTPYKQFYMKKNL